MGQNNAAGLGFPLSARQRASLSAVGRPYAPGSAMDPQSIGNMALRSAMQPPLQITNGFDQPEGMQPGQRPDEEEDGQSFANGGMVRGPGTGMSDSVKATVPAGTYIMPADSTQQIGPEKLAGLGFRPGMRAAVKAVPDLPLGFRSKSQRAADGQGEKDGGPGLGFRPRGVPVNLSNGEFKLTPEQVHAIGAEVLEGMKDATHEATEPREEGDGVARDGMFFADGGLVEDERKKPRPLATSPSNTYPGNQAEAAGNIYAKSNAEAADFAKAAFPGTATAIQGAGQAIQDAYNQGGIGAAVGQGFRGAMVPAVGLADDVMSSAAKVLNPAAQALKTLVTGDATPIGQAAAAAPPSAKPAQPAAPANPNYGNEPNAPAAPQAAPTALANNVTREGNSYSGKDIGPGFTVNGKEPGGGFVSGAAQPGGFSQGVGGPEVLGILQRENQIRAGMGELADRANFNSGGFGFRKVGTDEAIRDMLVKGNSRDRASALGFALRQQEMQGRQGIANEELGLKREAQGFQTRAQQRQEALQARYEAAKTPEERSTIAQQIRDLSGKEFQNRFTVVPGGQEIDSTTGQLVTRPARVINNQTGQFVDQPQAAAPQPVANHIAALKKNPEQAAMFDSVYGKGAAARYLGAGNGS